MVFCFIIDASNSHELIYLEKDGVSVSVFHEHDIERITLTVKHGKCEFAINVSLQSVKIVYEVCLENNRIW